MNTPLIRVREAREVLSYIPYCLGFRPRESLVALSVRGDRGRLGLLARLDLTDLADATAGDALARQLARRMASDGAARVVLALYTDTSRAEVRSGAGCAGVALTRVRRALVPDLPDDAWLIGSSGYAGIDCEDMSCCPPDGRPLVELESTGVGAAMVFSGAAVAERREDLGVTHRAAAESRRAAARAASRERARRRALGGRVEGLTYARAPEDWIQECVVHWAALRRSEREGRTPTPVQLGRLLAGLEDPNARDAMILALVHESQPDRAPDSDALALIFSPGGVAPDRAVLQAAKGVLAQAAAHASTRGGAPPLTVLAWLAWWEGDGARAAVLVTQALRAEPSHRLARLLEESLARGIAPGWARTRDREPATGGRSRGRGRPRGSTERSRW